MGNGIWNVGTYDTRASANAAAGRSTFDYTDRVRSGRASGVNPLVDPTIKAGAASPHAGKVMREVMISTEHPDPTAIAIVLDVTGSNYEAAVTVHSKLPNLHGVLQAKAYVSDPQIMFVAVGDANSDSVPLQVGQFESDNRMDEQLEAIVLEGGGGGQNRETYELAAYFLALHTYLEPFERTGRKGYVFFIGDEMPYDAIRNSYGRHTLQSLVGDTIEADIATEQIFTELKERYEVFFLFQARGSYKPEDILPRWRKLLGERALVLDDPSAVCEFIAGVMGMLEAGLTTDEVETDLAAAGSDGHAISVAAKALAAIGSGSSAGAVTASGDLPAAGTGDRPTRGRL